MTIREAIENRERCLAYLIGCGPQASKENVEAVKLSLEALREKEERGWISVEDRPPEENQRVILYIPRVAEGGTVRIGWLEETKLWYTAGRDRLLYKQVTHWMPLPEPPQEVNT